MEDKLFEVGFTTFVITSLIWTNIWLIATVVRLSNKEEK